MHWKKLHRKCIKIVYTENCCIENSHKENSCKENSCKENSCIEKSCIENSWIENSCKETVVLKLVGSWKYNVKENNFKSFN